MALMSTALENYLLNALGSAHSGCALYFYSAPYSGGANKAATGTLLGIATVEAKSWTAETAIENGLHFAMQAVNGILSKSPTETWQFKGLAKGVVDWCRLVPGDVADSMGLDTTASHSRVDMKVALTGTLAAQTAEVTLSNINIEVGAITTIDTCTIRFKPG